ERRKLGIYGLGALDMPGRLLDILNDTEPAHSAERDLSIYVLRRWLSRGLEQGKMLYDAKNTDKGLLRDRKYTAKEAELIAILLHDLSEEAVQQPEAYRLLISCLNHEQLAVRELAYWQLQRLVRAAPGGKEVKLPAFNAAW